MAAEEWRGEWRELRGVEVSERELRREWRGEWRQLRSGEVVAGD